MRTVLQVFVDAITSKTRNRVFSIYGILLAFNLCAWIWAAVAFRHFPVLLGTAFLAYSFGLATRWTPTTSPSSTM